MFLPVFLVELKAQAPRSRSVVGWGESVLGLNQMPPLPVGVTANDIDVLASGELIGLGQVDPNAPPPPAAAGAPATPPTAAQVAERKALVALLKARGA